MGIIDMIVGRTFLCAASMLASAAVSARNQPNIVLILADDMGYGDVSAYNPDSRIQTPHIDALCSTGVRFTSAHACASLSTPSRYGLLTGRYAFRTPLFRGVLNGYSASLIEPGRSTVASMLQKCGYSTACIGKWHLGWTWAKIPGGQDKDVDWSTPISDGPCQKGFDYFFGIAASLDMPPYIYVENDWPQGIPDVQMIPDTGLRLIRKGPRTADFDPSECLGTLTAKAEKYISDMADSPEPFFLYMPLTAPHTPILPDKEFAGKSLLSPYGDFVMMVDDVVGRIINTLETHGILEDTMIIFASDNGCAPMADINGMKAKGHYPSYIFRGAKSDLFEGGHRIPMVVSWNGRNAGKVDDGLVCLTDLYATFAELTGWHISDNEAEDSASFLGRIDKSSKGRKFVRPIVLHSADGSLSLKDGKWKFLRTRYSGGWSSPSPKDGLNHDDLPEYQLYNIRRDPAETRNLYERKRRISDRMSSKLAELTE